MALKYNCVIIMGGIDDPHRHASGDYCVQKYFLHGEYSLSMSAGIDDPQRHAASDYCVKI